MPKNSGAIDQAVYEALAGDAALGALMPDGVYFDRAPQGSARFVVVTLVPGGPDVYAFDGYGIETLLYRVAATVLATQVDAANAAAVRIDAVLHDQTPATFPIAGYKVMRSERTEPLTEPRSLDDPENTSVRWLQRGGYYRIQVQPDV